MINLKEMREQFSRIDILKEQYEEIIDLENKEKLNELTVAVMGQFKRGKSSLINSMLGEELLPIGIIPLTTVITEIRYGESFKAVVCYEDNREEEIASAQIEEFCSEGKNPGNSKNVKTMKIWTPLQPFGPNIVIADTPGVGSINKHNTDSSYDYIKQCDVILFLLSVDSPVSESERDFLLESKEFAQKFFFAINKIDNVQSDDLNAFKEYCQDTISKYLGQNISIATISARTKAGIKELEENICNELAKHHDELLEDSIEQKAAVIKSQAEAKLELLRIAAESPVEEVEKKFEKIKDKQEEIGRFADELQVISNHRTDKLIEKTGVILDEQASKINDELKKTGEELFSKLENLSPSKFEEEFIKALNISLTSQIIEMRRMGLEYLKKGYFKITNELQDKTCEVSKFISKVLKEEFNLDYPVFEKSFFISDKSDFTMHIGFESKMMPDMNTFNRFLPKKTANQKFYSRSMEQALEDVKKNRNNILYDYKYKMQESLRGFCIDLVKETEGMKSELNNISKHIDETLHMADRKKEEETKIIMDILNRLN